MVTPEGIDCSRSRISLETSQEAAAPNDLDEKFEIMAKASLKPPGASKP